MDIIVNLFHFSFSFPLLPTIEMETTNHYNLTFLYASKYKNWNHQIHIQGKIGMKTNIHSHSLFPRVKHDLKVINMNNKSLKHQWSLLVYIWTWLTTVLNTVFFFLFSKSKQIYFYFFINSSFLIFFLNLIMKIGCFLISYFNYFQLFSLFIRRAILKIWKMIQNKALQIKIIFKKYMKIIWEHLKFLN